MKFKKNREPIDKPQTKAPDDDVLQELDADDMTQISGAGNPFAERPRVGLQSIDEDLRNNG